MTGETPGLSRILSGFTEFAGGITATPPATRPVAHALTRQATSVSVPHINGDLPGEVAGVEFWLHIQQLELAPAEDLLNSRYAPEEDPDFTQFTQAVADLGDHAPALPVLPAQRNIQLGERDLPLFLIYDHPAIFYALQALRRARVRVYLPDVPHAGAILLQALAREGQLRREPSILEVCHATKRLRDVYHYTLEEIAMHEARNREDHTRPSTTYVHYQIKVASLPEVVQDLLHRRHILWTHARMIAEHFLEDDRMCELVALLASQGARMSVDGLETVIKRIEGKHCRLEQDDHGVVQVIPEGGVLRLVGESAPARASAAPILAGAMIARPGQIARQAGAFHVAIIPDAKPERVSVAPAALHDLAEWLTSRQGSVPIREVEATLLGFLHAVRTAAHAAGLTNAEGALAPMVEAR